MDLDGSHDYRHFTCGGCGYSFNAPVSCGNRFCDVCQGSRRRKIRAKLTAIIKSRNADSGNGIKLLTLTIPNQEDIRYATVQILRSFRRLRQRSFWRNKCSGGSWIVEITGSPKKWHVHLHALLESRYIPYAFLSKHWSQVSLGKIVYISKVPSGAAIGYVTSYVSKSKCDPNYWLHISQQLKDTRLFQPFGSWHAAAAEIPSIAYSCPECDYTGFFLNRADRRITSPGNGRGGTSMDAHRHQIALLRGDFHGPPVHWGKGMTMFSRKQTGIKFS